MSNEKVLYSHELVIRFDQMEGNRVNWSIHPDELLGVTHELSLIDLAECGAPLAAIGIRALWKMCADGLVNHSLELANSVQVDVGKRVSQGSVEEPGLLVPEGATIN